MSEVKSAVSQRTLRLGSQGNDVIFVQTVLNVHGFGPLVEDGIFGVTTEAAVKRYQADRGLVVDGIVGPSTWTRLIHDAN
jgi:peptidoglycan hydrolase-like protein with peptidoglycan-binding domain